MMATDATDVHINDLPDVLLIRILFYLDQVELHLSVSWVCERWNTICYDRDLWRSFNQLEYEQGLHELIDTKSLQYYLLRRVHSHIRYISISDEGLSLLPFLHEIGLPSLQMLILPEADTDLSEHIVGAVKNIQQATSAKVYTDVNRPLCCDQSVSVSMFDDIATGIEDSVHTPTTDWEEIGRRLQENCDRTTVSLICNEQVLPVEFIKQLSKMEKILELQLLNCCLLNLNEMTEQNITLICRNILSLNINPKFTASSIIHKLLSNSQSVRCLSLHSVTASCLSDIPHACKYLTELCLYEISEPNDSCYLTDIAYHCTKLKRVTMNFVNGRLNSFLLVLVQRCRCLSYLNLDHCSCHDWYQERNGLAEVLNECAELQTLKVSCLFHSASKESINLFSIHTYDGSSKLHTISIQLLPMQHTSLEMPVELLNKMCYLTTFCLVSLETITVEFIQVLSQCCYNISHLKLHERKDLSKNLETRMREEGDSDILCHLNLSKIKDLDLHLKCATMPGYQIGKYLLRSSFLEKLDLDPASEDSINVVNSILGNRPHLFHIETCKLTLSMVSEVRWKQLTGRQWRDTWRSLVINQNQSER